MSKNPEASLGELAAYLAMLGCIGIGVISGWYFEHPALAIGMGFVSFPVLCLVFAVILRKMK